MKRFMMLFFGGLVAALVVAVYPVTVAEARWRDDGVRVNRCTYCAHGSAAERAQYDKPPGTPGNGPGGGSGGGNKAPCSKTFAAWQGVSVLDVFIDGSGGPIAAANFEDYAKLSFQEWACNSGIGESIVIHYVGTADGADIVIQWGDLGSTGILGQAYTPTQGKRILFSEVTMNSNQQAFQWVLGPVPAVDSGGCAVEVGNGNIYSANYDLLSVMLHEVGHALGIAHPSRFCDASDPCYPESMFPCTAAEEWMRRAADPGDIASIQSNYGADGA